MSQTVADVLVGVLMRMLNCACGADNPGQNRRVQKLRFVCRNSSESCDHDRGLVMIDIKR